jgi:hypothetical protein
MRAQITAVLMPDATFGNKDYENWVKEGRNPNSGFCKGHPNINQVALDEGSTGILPMYAAYYNFSPDGNRTVGDRNGKQAYMKWSWKKFDVPPWIKQCTLQIESYTVRIEWDYVPEIEYKLGDIDFRDRVDATLELVRSPNGGQLVYALTACNIANLDELNEFAQRVRSGEIVPANPWKSS